MRMVFCYWGSDDPLGRDDCKCTYMFSGNDAETMRSDMTTVLTECERMHAARGSLVRPLRSVEVGGNGTTYTRALQSLGLVITLRTTGLAPFPDDVER